jgi:hypothetical protein
MREVKEGGVAWEEVEEGKDDCWCSKKKDRTAAAFLLGKFLLSCVCLCFVCVVNGVLELANSCCALLSSLQGLKQQRCYIILRFLPSPHFSLSHTSTRTTHSNTNSQQHQQRAHNTSMKFRAGLMAKDLSLLNGNKP